MSAARNHDGSDAAPPNVADPPAEAVMAHVLFMDIVGSSRLTTDRQPPVRGHAAAATGSGDRRIPRKARTAGDLVSLPTGDGIALVFFRSPEQPAGCALDIARALRKDAFCQVRMGIHSGPVFLIEDINGARNVSGAGINQAERVMSCGGGGHILMSESVADPLRHLSRWKDRLHDAGICRSEGRHSAPVESTRRRSWPCGPRSQPGSILGAKEINDRGGIVGAHRRNWLCSRSIVHRGQWLMPERCTHRVALAFLFPFHQDQVRHRPPGGARNGLSRRLPTALSIHRSSEWISLSGERRSAEEGWFGLDVVISISSVAPGIGGR